MPGQYTNFYELWDDLFEHVRSTPGCKVSSVESFGVFGFLVNGETWTMTIHDYDRSYSESGPVHTEKRWILCPTGPMIWSKKDLKTLMQTEFTRAAVCSILETWVSPEYPGPPPPTRYERLTGEDPTYETL